MKPYLRDFLRDDAGAITIDWVALTAGLLLLGIMVVYAIFNGGVSGLVNDISSTLASINTDVDTGDAPGLNGSDVVVASDTFDLVGGGTVPIGSTVVATGCLSQCSSSENNAIEVRLENGNHMVLETADGSPMGTTPPSGSTTGANSTFNLAGGGSISSSSVSGSGLICTYGCDSGQTT